MQETNTMTQNMQALDAGAKSVIAGNNPHIQVKQTILGNKGVYPTNPLFPDGVRSIRTSLRMRTPLIPDKKKDI